MSATVGEAAMAAGAVSALLDFGLPQDGPQARLRCAFGAPLRVLQADRADQVLPLLDAVQAESAAGRWCVGFVAYEAAPAFDAALRVHDADGPLAWFAVFDQAMPWPDAAELAALPPASARWDEGPDRAGFARDMAAIQSAIAAGDCYQINHTARLSAVTSEVICQTVGSACSSNSCGTLTENGCATRERSLRIRSTIMTFSARSLSDARSAAALAWSASGVAPRAAVPFMGRTSRRDPSQSKNSSGETDSSWRPPMSRYAE